MAAVKTRNTASLMTEGSIVKSLLLFALPLIFGNLLQQMYNTADSIIVGNFVGSNALAAVGSSGSPIYLLIGFSQGLAVGAGVVVSQYLGAGDHKETREAVHTSLAIAVVMGLLLTVGGVACGRALLVAMNTPAEVLADAVTYIRTYFGGVLFSVVYNMTAGILNAAGNSRRSLVYLAWASVTNIVLDFLLVGVLRGGGDGRASLLFDNFPLWCVELPLMCLLGLVLKVPNEVFCLCIAIEHLAKTPVGLWRIHSGKWVQDSTRSE